MKRRTALKALAVGVGTLAVLGTTAQPANAYYYYFQYRFTYYVQRNRRRARWAGR